MDPQKSMFIVFEEKPQHKCFSWCLSLYSALKARVAQCFLCVKKNTDLNNISASIVLKAKTKKK